MLLKEIKTIIFKVICLLLMLVSIGWAYSDFYDIKGDFLFNGDPLYEFWAYNSPSGGFQGRYYSDYGQWDRFLRDFGSSMTIYEWINNREYELKLGRFGTWFTPLTLHKERYRWGYPGLYRNFNTAYNEYHWDWGRWWDQRGARIRAKQGNDEWIGLVAKTAYPGADDDDWWAGDIDKDRYFMGLRHRSDIFGMNVGFSMVNEHYTNFKTNDTTQPDSFSAEGPLSGVIDDNPPTYIYLKFTDDSPVDEAKNPDWEGAAIYEIRTFVNGKEVPSLSYIAGQNGSDVDYWGRSYTWSKERIEASGPHDEIIFQFDMSFQEKPVKSVRFEITAANDYRMEAGRDYPWNWNSLNDNYVLFARAPGNVKDYSNKTVITYKYGEHTGTTVLGTDIEGNLPGLNMPFKAEYATSAKFYKYPEAGGERTNDIGKAAYLKINKELYPLLLVGEFYDFDFNYAADFAVEDNDDLDDKPDIVDDYVAWYREFPGARSDDDFVLFKVDRYFREGLDLNNNKAFDNEENDTKPDYPYREGQKGYIFSSALRPFSGMKFETAFIDSTEKMSDRRNQTLFGKAKYNLDFPKVGVELRDEIKNTKDNIPDNLVYDPENPNPWAFQGSENWQDPITFRNNFVNNTYVTVRYKLIPQWTLYNRYLYGIDQRYYSGEMRNYQNGIVRTYYDNWFPFRDFPVFRQWQFIPMYKLEVWLEEATKNDMKWSISNWRKDAFALILQNKLTEKTSLFIGEQVWIYDDRYSGNDNNRYVFATEVVHSDQYWNRPFMFTAGMKFVNQEADLEWNRQKYEFLYIKSYFQW